MQGSLFPDEDARAGSPAAPWAPGTVFTIGHSTHAITAFIALLRGAGIELLADVRSIPRSRRHPQFNSEALPGPLAKAGIAYRHLGALGGRRHRPADAPPSPNLLWQNDAFRNFSDYALGEAFRAGLDEFRLLAQAQPSALMCAEALWWRCHRRIIADHLLVLGLPVVHILASGKTEVARLTPGAVAGPRGPVYPLGECP